MENVNIKIIETNQYFISNKAGFFNVQLNNIGKTTLTFEFSYIGYQKLIKQVKLETNRFDFGKIVLNELSLNLATIDINAKRNYEGSSNSSLIISRDIIERTPALSITDLLNQIPNRKVNPPSLQNVQNLTLRSTYAPTTNNRGAFEMSNAFGVAIIVDGNAISNNMNMQSFNPGLLGMGNSYLNSENSYGLNGSSTTAYSGDYAFSGTDLRQIPADNIESIEVISGVAPAKYGDLSEGAVIVELQAGKAPAYLRTQLRDNATSYGYSQGFSLSPKAGSLNIGVNYTNSFADNRDKIKAYKRINLSTKHTNFYGKEKRLKNTLSIDYGRNLDGIKNDPDDINKTGVRYDSWNFSVANRSFYRLNNGFIKNISLNLRYAEGHQVSYREQFRNDPYAIISEALTTGIHEGEYVKGIYTAQSLIDGRPVNATAKLDFSSDLKTGNITHFIDFGLSYDYGANKGLGQVLDPTRPRILSSVSPTSVSPNRSERYYDFSLAVAQQNVGFYIDDVFKTSVFKKDLNVRLGARYDIQNALPTFSPRINANYALTKNIKIGLAYGLAFKSPSLAQRYPGPSYYEIPLLNAYNGNAAESTYLVYVNRYDPTSKDIKSAKSQTLEFTSQLKFDNYNISISLFNKQSRNGISTVAKRKFVELPTYVATTIPNQKPIVTQTGTKVYNFTYYEFKNDLSSDNNGIELIVNSPKIETIATSFNLTAGLYQTKYHTESLRQKSFDDEAGNTKPNYAILGFYEPNNRTSYLSNASLSSSTHIPKISLIISFIADFSLLRRTILPATAGVPLAYLTRDGRHISIPNPDPQNQDYKHLFIPSNELNEDNLPKIIPNFHLSMAKEFKKRIRFAFNVYNVFNYQPYYITSSNNYIFPNNPPTFGAEISLKL